MFNMRKSHWRLYAISCYYWFLASLVTLFGIIVPLWQLFSLPAQQSNVLIPGIVILNIFLALWLWFLGWWLSRRSVGAHGFAVITQGVFLLFFLPIIYLLGAYGVVFLIVTGAILACLLDQHTRLMFLE